MAGAVRAAEGMHRQVRWHWARGVQVWQEIQRLCFLHHVTNAFLLHTVQPPQPRTCQQRRAVGGDEDLEGQGPAAARQLLQEGCQGEVSSGLQLWIADRRVAGGWPADGFWPWAETKREGGTSWPNPRLDRRPHWHAEASALNKLMRTWVAWYASQAPMEWPKNTNGRWCRMGSSSGSISLQRGKEQQGREQ